MKDAIDEKNGLFGTNLAFKISPSWSLGQERKEGFFLQMCFCCCKFEGLCCYKSLFVVLFCVPYNILLIYGLLNVTCTMHNLFSNYLCFISYFCSSWCSID